MQDTAYGRQVTGGLEGKEPTFTQTSSLPGASLLTQELRNVHSGFIQKHGLSVPYVFRHHIAFF